MKYIRFLAVLTLCCLLLAIPVMGLSGAAELSGSAFVLEDGSCQIQMTLELKLEENLSDLTFPLPRDATNVFLGGQVAQVRTDGEYMQLCLPAMTAGSHTFLLQYSLPCQLSRGEEEVLLTLPILCGFGLPIEALEFSVTLPGAITGKPVFVSGYYQENIRPDTQISENTIHVTLQEDLKDHETLSLQLPVEEELFDLVVARQRLFTRWDIGMLVVLVLAMLYFCLGLMPKIPHIGRHYTAPEGISAGEVGSCLTGCGTDLTMTVLTWAQLGYVLIERTRNGRILLHKRMEMGNERSYHEGRIFQILFGRRITVDPAGPHFVRLSRKVAGRSPLLKQLYKVNSGDIRVFRILCCGAGFCCGIQMVSGGFGAFLFGVLAAGLSYFIQSGGKCIPLRNKLPLLIGVGCGLLWLGLGVLTHSMARVVPMVIFQYIAGIFAAYGGKRSELGQQMLTQLLGLRRHMMGASAFDMQLLQQKNPNYFHELAPFALAMGIDRQFARRFDGKTPLPDGGWLKGAPDMTATQWMDRLRHTADQMNRARYVKK